MDRINQNQANQRGRPVSSVDAAKANEYFEQFVNAATLKHILGYYRGLIENLHLKPNVFTHFYPKLRANLTSWRAKALWKKFDARASHKCYHKGKATANTRVLIIGGGPCGMRTAIEAQLLGAKVVVVEKRDRFSRNNVLHLWPFVIEDLRMLGAKKFFGKFCAGAIDHISIRQLQCILLKVALLLGVEVHTEVSFDKLIEPSATEKTGWRAEFKPSNHPVSHYEFDVIIGADGKRNTLQGFSRKEFRGKLAIAITANFINKKTEAEARVEEISGVAFIFNQKFFKELQEETRIDLENIVYYKDDTHYFVMTAKKASLLEKGVIKQDLADTEKLLAPDNVDREALQQYAIEAANFSTNYQMPNLEFAVNHYGQPDIAMFDFTSMYAAENASKVLERNGHRLLMILVGDSLLEPFWPTGSGCARGFLSSLDAAWAIRSWSLGTLTPLDVLSERESIYRLLAQTTPDNLNKDWKSYTLDPATRYPNLNKTVVTPHQVVYLYDSDSPTNIEKMKRSSIERPSDVPRKRRRGNVDNDVLLSWLKGQLKEEIDITVTDIGSVFKSGKCLCAIIHHYRPDLLDYNSVKDDDPVKNNQLAIDILEKELGIPPVMTGQEITNTEDYLTMATYLTEIYNSFKGEIPHIKHPKLELPESTKMSDLSFKTIKTSNIQAFANQPSRPSSRHKRHIEMPPNKTCSIDKKTRKRRAIEKVGASVDHENKVTVSTSRTGGTDEDLAARIKSLEDKWKEPEHVERKPKDLLRAIGKIENSDWNIREIEKKIMENKMGKPSKVINKEKVPKWSKEQFLARQTKMEKKHLDRQESAEAKFADIDKTIKDLDQKLKEGTVRQLGTNKVATLTEKLVSKIPPELKPPEKSVSRPPVSLPLQGASEMCHFCGKRVYLMERLSAEGRFFHHGCFKCQYCHTQLRLGSYAFDRDGMYGFKFFCLHHFGMVGELEQPKITRKLPRLTIDLRKSPEKKTTSNISGVDLLDRVQTPERVEFANLSMEHVSSDQDESISQMDEDEWTDKNFGASCAEVADSDDESSSLSDTDSDDEDAYDDALEEPVTKEGTMKWAERLKNSYSRKKHDSDSNGYSSSDQSSYYDSSDDDESETATEGEEEIRARELRKQEVRVEPPVVQTDTGTDTEVKSSFQINPVLSTTQSIQHCLVPHSKNLNNSSDNISVNSTEYNSAESGDVDLNMNKIKAIDEKNVVVGKLSLPQSLTHKLKESSDDSAHNSSGQNSPKPKRNFVIPQKHKNVTSEFVSKFASPEPEPLLVIRRTPSKISLPKEVGKPKTLVNTKGLDTNKYFGPKTTKNKPLNPLKRSETMATELTKAPLIKQKSLPETADEIKDIKTFNFEPEDSDLKEIDNYIEDLIANEDELYKPIDPNKYKAIETPSSSEDEKCSSSIEDLLKALETETTVKADEVVEEKTEEKIDDLLTWIEGLEHQTPDKKINQSFSEVKYKNLEKILKMPTKSDAIISKIPKQDLSIFESHLLGKESLVDDESDAENPDVRIGSFGLKRSKTEISCNRYNKGRSSVDLEAVGKVNIKKMLQKFESKDEDEVVKEKSKSPLKVTQKRNSFAAFKSLSTEREPFPRSRPSLPKPNPIKNTIKIFEGNNNAAASAKPPKFRSVSASSSFLPFKAQDDNFENLLSDKIFGDLEKFVEDTLKSIGNKYEPGNQQPEPETNKWQANVTVRTIPSELFNLENSTINLTNDQKSCSNESTVNVPNKFEMGLDKDEFHQNKEPPDLLNTININQSANNIGAKSFDDLVSDLNSSKADNDQPEEAKNEQSNNEAPQNFAPLENVQHNQFCPERSDETAQEQTNPCSQDVVYETPNVLGIMKYMTILKNANSVADNTDELQPGTSVPPSSNLNTQNEKEDFLKSMLHETQTPQTEKQVQNSSNIAEMLVPEEKTVPVVETKNIFVNKTNVSSSEDETSDSSYTDDESDEIVEGIQTPHDFSKAVESTDTSMIEDNSSSVAEIPTPSSKTVEQINERNNKVVESKTVEPLYAEVHKNEQQSPPIPQRHKKYKTEIDQPPIRPARQKSFERPNHSETSDNRVETPPTPPQRRSTPKTSPLPPKKSLNVSSQDASAVKKEVAKTYNLPKPETVTTRSVTPDASTSSLSKSGDRSRSRDSDVECCIQ